MEKQPAYCTHYLYVCLVLKGIQRRSYELQVILIIMEAMKDIFCQCFVDTWYTF